MFSALKLLHEWKPKLKTVVNKLTFIVGAVVFIAIIVLVTVLFISKPILKVSAQDLMKDIKSEKVGTTELSKEFIQATGDFSVDLFKNAYTKGENSLVSPPSIYLALGMTANGADGNTLKELL